MTTQVKISKRSRLRERLFELFSANLNWINSEPCVHLEPNIPDTYICPLCVQLFTKEALDQQKHPNPLTLEDVPPKAVGGKPVLLTCKNCNSTSGRKLDIELIKKINWLDFNNKVPGTVVGTKIELHNGMNISGTISTRGANGFDIHLFKDGPKCKSGKGKCPQIVQDDIRENGIRPVQLNFKLHKKGYPEIALLRIAYLMAFSTFGNGFLLNSNLEKIREQIAQPEKNILKGFGILPFDFSSIETGLYVVVEPKELWCFLAIFRLNEHCTCNVVLPGPSAPGIDIYHYLKTHDVANDKIIKFMIRKCPERDYLADESMKFESAKIWDALVSGKL